MIELAKFAADAGIQVTVCHLPPGTSKWNKIEHRLFSQITINWRGRPLVSHQVIVDLIVATTTITGRTVQCVLDTAEYPIGIKYTNADIDALPLTRHDFHGNWNYTLTPPDKTRHALVSRNGSSLFWNVGQFLYADVRGAANRD